MSNVVSINSARSDAVEGNFGSRAIKASLESLGIHASRRQLRQLAAEGVLNTETVLAVLDEAERAA